MLPAFDKGRILCGMAANASPPARPAYAKFLLLPAFALALFALSLAAAFPAAFAGGEGSSGARVESIGDEETRHGSKGAKPAEAPKAETADAEAVQPGRGNLAGHGGPVKALAVDPQRQLVLSGSFDYAMMVWSVPDDGGVKVLHRFDQHDGAVNAVAFVPGTGHVLSAGDGGALSMWDLKSGERIARLEGHTAKVVGIAVSPDGTAAITSSWDRTARLWDLAKKQPGPVLEGHKGPVNAATFSEDGAQVFTAGYDGEIRLFDAKTGEPVRPIYRHGWGINVLERLPGSSLLAFGALNGAAGVIDPASGKVVAELGDAERPILALATTAQPGLIAVGGGDGKVRVFRLGDYQTIEEYENPYGPAWGLAFAPGGQALYIAGLDDFVYRWTITPRQPFEEIDSPYPRRFQVSDESDDPVARGRVHFMRKCSVCHTLKPDGRNRAGPTLYRLFGRRIGSLPDYPYSNALKGMDIVWTAETVGKLFEQGPEHFTPGSKMPLQKMTDANERDALIAYLKTTPAAGKEVPTSPPPDNKEETE